MNESNPQLNQMLGNLGFFFVALMLGWVGGSAVTRRYFRQRFHPHCAQGSRNGAVCSLARTMYERYCISVGGRAFNGDPLPGWVDFCADPKKVTQAEAWFAVARHVLNCLRPE